jgi:hypothetical protein
VPKSSISADITAANSKMAQHLRAQEEQQGLGIGRRKVRDVAARDQQMVAKSTKKSRWQQPADFSVPTPMVDRPRTSSGSTSFHFSYTSVSKEGSPTANGKPVSTGSSGSTNPGADHSKYIEREGAAEYSLGADHASYIEREEAVELTDRAIEAAEGFERTLGDNVYETPTEEEAKMLGKEDVKEGVPSIFSNISGDPFEREEYWRAVHRSEREPKTHQLIPDPSVNPTWWAQMETWPDMNEGFRAHCLMEVARYRQWQSDDKASLDGKPFERRPFQADAEVIGRALQGARKTPGWNEIDPPVAFQSGRGGRVQYRFVAELPHELRPEDRALIVQNFCDHLASFGEGPDGRPTGMMYTAVIHAPDAHNDRRNYHLHVIAHDRPAKWMEEHGKWDFEVAETYNHKGQDRIRYPYRQNKIGEVVRKDKNATGTYNDKAGRDFVPAMRQRYADITNAVMSLRGIDRRLDPRRYEEMGIDRTPTKHLGTKAAALESIGVPTEIGRENAAAIWNDAQRAIERRAKEVDASLKTEQRALVQLAEDVQRTAPRSETLRTLRVLAAERESLIDAVADDRRLIMTFDHLEAKAKSRAIRTRQTCLQFLTDIQHGVADRTTSSSIKQIQERWREAQNHIEAIDRDLAPERPMLAAAAQDVITREERIKQIDGLLQPIKAALDNAAREAREERELRDRKRDRATILEKRDAAEAEASKARQAETEASRKAASEPEAQTPSARTTEAASPSPRDATSDVVKTAPVGNATTTITKENDDVRTRNDAAALLRAGWVTFPAPEPGPHGAAGLSSAPALASVRDLSGLQLVHHGDGSEVLLQRVPSVVLERQGGGGDVVRREGGRDPADDVGQGRGVEASGRTDRPETASLQPISIEGLPIAKPTIDPSSSPIATPSELAAANGNPIDANVVPEGLVPVREKDAATVPGDPAEPAIPIDAGAQPIRTALDEPTAESSGVDPSRMPVQADTPSERSDDAGTGPTPASETPEKVDGRRKVEDPVLFPLEPSMAPEKPGTLRAEHTAWDELIKRISSDRVLVTRVEDARGRATFEVPSLSAREQATLGMERFGNRTAARLGAIHQSQQREVERLIRWIVKEGRNPDQLAIVDRRAKVADAPKSVHRLMKDWGVHPMVGEALRAEATRRAEEASKARTADRVIAPEPAATIPSKTISKTPDADATIAPEREDERLAREQRVADLRRLLPEPSAALTDQVETLIRLLREDADRKELQAAAERVRLDAAAREDVHRHGLDLSQRYNTILDEAGQGFGFQPGRGNRGGR